MAMAFERERQGEKRPAEQRPAAPPSRRPEWIGRVAVAVALVIGALVAGHAFTHFVDVKYRDGVQVSGSASRRIQSDRAIWSAVVKARGSTVAEAYAVLHRDVPRVRQWLLDQHVPANAIRVESVVTTELFPHDENGEEQRERILGYELTQEVEVTSNDVDLVGRVARDVTQLIHNGVQVESFQPEYIYTDLGTVKIQLVGRATADARARAMEVARNSHARLGPLVSADVGVVQVNAANQTEVSWEGVYDRTSVDKDVMIVVRTMFLLE
jgi:uncharacterized protein